ncbi:MAG: HAD-superfamily hydrolase, subfamily variant 3 [Gammaproteobacteria bacterium]|jgi:putative hydrolase of the HAD superfamily|nr:HAD-superfamily hydrolase, subfamily variant 3 [Gammaproteobacteria bacterium]
MKYKNIIFDIGNVLLNWQPELVIQSVFPGIANPASYAREIFLHADWIEFDRGTHSEPEIEKLLCSRLNIPVEQAHLLTQTVKSSLSPKHETIALLNELEQQDYQLYCLTNMSGECFEYIKAKYDFWPIFKHITVSGYVKLVKPEPAIYLHLLETNKIKAEESIFIDDVLVNVQGAESVNITGIQFTEFDSVYQRLKQLLG